MHDACASLLKIELNKRSSEWKMLKLPVSFRLVHLIGVCIDFKTYTTTRWSCLIILLKHICEGTASRVSLLTLIDSWFMRTHYSISSNRPGGWLYVVNVITYNTMITLQHIQTNTQGLRRHTQIHTLCVGETVHMVFNRILWSYTLYSFPVSKFFVILCLYYNHGKRNPATGIENL